VASGALHKTAVEDDGFVLVRTKKCGEMTVAKSRGFTSLSTPAEKETIVSGFPFGKLEIPIASVFQIGNADG